MTGTGIYEKIQAYCQTVSGLQLGTYNGDMVAAAQAWTGFSRAMTVDEAELLLLQTTTRNLTSVLADMRQYWPSVLAGTYTTYDAAASTLFAAMSPVPVGARKVIINNCIVALKAAGLWTKLGLLYITAAAASQPATVNWVNPGVATLTAVNSPVFAVDRGWTGDGATSYLTTGVNQTAAPLYAQNDAHAGVWGAGQSGNVALGLLGSTVLTTRTADSRLCRVNAAANSATASDSSGGYTTAVRRDSANQFTYKNGTAELTNAVASASLVASAVTILRGNTSFYGGQINAAHVGSQLSAAEVLALYGILRTYMTAVGVP